VKNVTYIISNIHKSLAFEWIAEGLDPKKFTVSFILLNPGDSELETFLRKNHFRVERVRYTGKKNIPKAVLKVYRILKRQKCDVVHTHLFDANMVGLPAAKLAGVKKRVHTRHHSSYHHEYHPKAVRYDRYINRWSTHIIAISEIVKKILVEKENVDPKKVRLVYHGFPLNSIYNQPENEVSELKKKYNPYSGRPVIGVISRYTHWKGIQYIIPAFKELLKKHPDALLILANANGEYSQEIKKQLHDLPHRNFTEIEFEHNIFALYKLFDVFVHVPINQQVEAFGQVYVEALAAHVPSVFTLSGIANEFIEHGSNALVVNYGDSSAIYDAIDKILNDDNLKKTLVMNGVASIQEKFELKKMISSLENIYAE